MQGLDYPGVGPEHAWMKDMNRATYCAVTDKEALEGFLLMTRLEGMEFILVGPRALSIHCSTLHLCAGIIPALETAHAVYHTLQLAKTLPKDKDVLLCVSGRGDKDVNQIRAALPKFGLDPKVLPSL